MNIELFYGTTGHNLFLPDDLEVEVIRKRAMAPLDDPRRRFAEALGDPIGLEPLHAALRGGKALGILICDDTRPVPNGWILEELLRHLDAAGAAPGKLTVLVATGLHGPLSKDVLSTTVGYPPVFARADVVSHDARDAEAHVFLGRTASGTPIYLDRRFVEADVKLVVGLVEPHFMAGYSGGRKLIAPGVAAAETISHLHAYRVLSHPDAANCRLRGNPLHAEQLEIAGKLGPVYAVNVVLDEHRRVCHLSFGDLLRSHDDAVEAFARCGVVPIDRPYMTVITTAAGHPLDNTYYQTVKGMVGAVAALAPGGRMLVASRCAEGFGSREFAEAQRHLVRLGSEGFLAMLAEKPTADIDEWQTQLLAEVLTKGSFGLYTEGLNARERALTAVLDVPDLEGQILAWIEACGDNRLAVIPEGPYVIPQLREG
jgi:nickel-dependent lactate racemase